MSTLLRIAVLVLCCFGVWYKVDLVKHTVHLGLEKINPYLPPQFQQETKGPAVPAVVQTVPLDKATISPKGNPHPLASELNTQVPGPIEVTPQGVTLTGRVVTLDTDLNQINGTAAAQPAPQPQEGSAPTIQAAPDTPAVFGTNTEFLDQTNHPNATR